MAKIETHCDDCMRLLGAEFLKVHKWLDEFTKEWPPHIYLEYHRKFRHNAEGVIEAGELFGPLGDRAAKIHIIRDVELYVLSKEFKKVMGDEIDELYERALNYCHW